jgi:hypothetical protein
MSTNARSMTMCASCLHSFALVPFSPLRVPSKDGADIDDNSQKTHKPEANKGAVDTRDQSLQNPDYTKEINTETYGERQ